MFSDRHATCPMCEHAPAGPSFRSLAIVFVNLAESKMSQTQKLVLIESERTLRFREISLTSLADLISRSTGVAYSTVKWNIRSLVSMGFLVGGDATNRGEPARCTEVAKMLVNHLDSIV